MRQDGPHQHDTEHLLHYIYIYIYIYVYMATSILSLIQGLTRLVTGGRFCFSLYFIIILSYRHAYSPICTWTLLQRHCSYKGHHKKCVAYGVSSERCSYKGHQELVLEEWNSVHHLDDDPGNEVFKGCVCELCQYLEEVCRSRASGGLTAKDILDTRVF